MPETIKQFKSRMMSKVPVNMDKMPQEDIDKQILRAIMIAELDSINLYEQMCYNTSDQDIKDVLEKLIEEEEDHFELAEELLEEKNKVEEDAED